MLGKNEAGGMETDDQERQDRPWEGEYRGMLVREPMGEAWGQERHIRSFEDLRVWQYCRQLRIELTQLARELPPEEKYRLTDQIIRASRSTTQNLAEGYGRYTYKDNIHFCRITRGSLYELIDHLITCHDEDYISDKTLAHYKDRCQSAIKMVNGYIRFLQNQQA